jgi:hypothetical protein
MEEPIMARRNEPRQSSGPAGGGHLPAGAIDSRLVSAVQRSAGARAHEAAGLLHGYHLWVSVWVQAGGQQDADLAKEAGRQVAAARTRLRQFLSRLCPTPQYAA